MKKQESVSALGSSGNCSSGKIGYTDRAGAKAHAAAVRRRNGEHLRPYRCLICPLWHVGHIPDDVLRGIRSADDHYQRGAGREQGADPR